MYPFDVQNNKPKGFPSIKNEPVFNPNTDLQLEKPKQVTNLEALGYSKKLTEQPGKMQSADAEALYAAGWSEAALLNIAEVCALFAMYNRLADGTGVIAGNTKTTLTANKKHGTYIQNLIDFGLKVPDDMTPVVDI